MGLRALYPKPRTSQPGVGHTVYPYRLRGLSIERPNQVWTDRYLLHPDGARVHVSGGHHGLVLAPRPGLAGIEHLRQRLLCRSARGRADPLRATEIFNTDQGAQFTSQAFTTVLKAHAVAISMDGKGRWIDNVFVERLWRSVKYEDVYLHSVRNTRRAPRRTDRLFSVLQRATASQCTWSADAGCGVLRRNRRWHGGLNHG